jgi:hypothetical protein
MSVRQTMGDPPSVSQFIPSKVYVCAFAWPSLVG